MKEFLTSYIKPKTGDIVLAETGKKIGQHDGAYYYTIGQRHGLDIKDGGGPYFVARKDIRKNIIYVTGAQQITNYKLQVIKIERVSWVGNVPKLPLNCQVKIRYGSESISATISRLNLEMGIV